MFLLLGCLKQYDLFTFAKTFALLLTGIHDFIPGACREWWSIWLALAGRSWGKTRTRTEWVHEHAVAGKPSRIALVRAELGFVVVLVIVSSPTR
jgi:phage terminase large subunit-like protein